MIILLPITDHQNILENVENITFGFSGFQIWIFTHQHVICYSKLMGDHSVGQWILQLNTNNNMALMYEWHPPD